MANLNGIEITKGKIGPNATGQPTDTSILIVSIAAIGPYPSITAGEIIKVYNLKDLENIDITKDNDMNNECLLHRHTSEFFRMSGEGTELNLVVVQNQSLQDILTGSNSIAKQSIIDAGGAVRQIGIATNLDNATALNGIDTDLQNAIPLAQELGEWAYENHFPLHILLEGRRYSGPANSVENLRALTLSANYVSVVIGQDWEYADLLPDADMKFYADLGTALGTTAASDINQNIGDNEAFNLTNEVRKIWQVPGLSNHVKNKDQQADLQTLENKGYIFGLIYTGLAGVRFNNDHVCAPIIIDGDGNINEHTIAFVRTMNESARLLRSRLLPKVKTRQPVDPNTGRLPVGVVKYFDGLGDSVFGDMEQRRQISGGKTFTDPTSDLLVEKSLRIQFRIVPTGTIGEILGVLNLKNTL